MNLSIIHHLLVDPGSEFIQRNILLNITEVPSEAESVEALFGEKVAVEVLLGETPGVVVGDLSILGTADELCSGLLSDRGAMESALEDEGETIKRGVAHRTNDRSCATARALSQARKLLRNLSQSRHIQSDGHRSYSHRSVIVSPPNSCAYYTRYNMVTSIQPRLV